MSQKDANTQKNQVIATDACIFEAIDGHCDCFEAQREFRYTLRVKENKYELLMLILLMRFHPEMVLFPMGTHWSF